MNRREIRQRILYQLNDDIVNPVYWDTREIDGIIQEAQEILSEEVEALRRRAYLPKREGSWIYSLDAIADDVMTPFRIWISDEEHLLRPTTIRWLNRERLRWMEDSTEFPDFWFPVTSNTFGVYPGTTEGGGTIGVDYLAWPTETPTDDDEPEYPLPDHDNLVLYGVYMGLMKQHDLIRALDYFTQFAQRLPESMVRSEIRKQGTIQAGRERATHANGFEAP